MDKIWHGGVIKYLQKKALATKDIHADRVTILEDVTTTLSKLQLDVGGLYNPNFGRPATVTTGKNTDLVQHIHDKPLTINQIDNAISIFPEIIENIWPNG